MGYFEDFSNPLTVEAMKPYENLNLLLTFEDNPSQKKVYNVKDDIEKQSWFAPLLDPDFFQQVTCEECCGVEWNEDIGISPEDLYYYSIPYEEWLQQQKNS